MLITSLRFERRLKHMIDVNRISWSVHREATSIFVHLASHWTENILESLTRNPCRINSWWIRFSPLRPLDENCFLFSTVIIARCLREVRVRRHTLVVRPFLAPAEHLWCEAAIEIRHRQLLTGEVSSVLESSTFSQMCFRASSWLARWATVHRFGMLWFAVEDSRWPLLT